MALEQTINRAQKGPGGIIGNAKKEKFVARWQLVYHELLSLTNLHREISGGNAMVGLPNNELNDADTTVSEKNVQAIANVLSKRGNPFVTCSSKSRLLGSEFHYRLIEWIISFKIMCGT